jgi:signal transduction histidine kinase/DNA-binding response OmpR family regulator
VSEPRTPSGGRRPLVWIVDDSPTEALIAERSLGSAYDFERFLDGSVVVERLAAGAPQPDLVLLDWVIPGMAGDEVCRFLRTDPRTLELPIILITASRIETSDVANGLASGANDYVARPFAAEELRARVDSAIRTKRLGDLAQQEDRRLSTINRLGRALLEARTDIPRILHELAASLTVSLCDGCSIQLWPGSLTIGAVTRHRADPSGESLAAIASVADPAVHSFASSEAARQTLPATYATYIARFGLRGLAILRLSSREPLRGIVRVTRDGSSVPFDDDDLATIGTCIEYAALAVESAMRFDAERAAERAVNAERERIAQFQQEMLGIVGHDLRGPLGAILIGTEMLMADRQHDPASVFVVTRIESCVKRMTRMVDQLLDVTRARLGHGIAVHRQKTPLLVLVRSVMEELSLAHPGTQLELVAAAEVVGLWDPDRLGQVMSNLLGNAVQYGLPGTPIVIGVACAEGTATITVHNQLAGEPIPPETLATLFEPYRRGGDHGQNTTGLGLGLYIVHEIVRAHGGTMDVESAASGTTFRVVLPEAGRLIGSRLEPVADRSISVAPYRPESPCAEGSSLCGVASVS